MEPLANGCFPIRASHPYGMLSQARRCRFAHMGMSYPPFQELCRSIQDANMIAKALPAQLAFVAIVGNKMLDRYGNLKVAFLEFGAEWIFYMFGRMEHYLKEIGRASCRERWSVSEM